MIGVVDVLQSLEACCARNGTDDPASCVPTVGEQKRPSKLPASLSHLTARDKMQRADGDHVGGSREQVQTLVKRQDETLTDVAARLGRLQKSAEAIGTELRSQGKMLDELGEERSGPNDARYRQAAQDQEQLPDRDCDIAVSRENRDRAVNVHECAPDDSPNCPTPRSRSTYGRV